MLHRRTSVWDAGGSSGGSSRLEATGSASLHEDELQDNSQRRRTIDCSQQSINAAQKPLVGLTVLVQVYTGPINCSDAYAVKLQSLGAETTFRFGPKVTHVVFKDGPQSTVEKARLKNLPIVSVCWVTDCAKRMKLLPVARYDLDERNEDGTPAQMILGNLGRSRRSVKLRRPDSAQRRVRKVKRVTSSTPLLSCLDTTAEPSVRSSDGSSSSGDTTHVALCPEAERVRREHWQTLREKVQSVTGVHGELEDHYDPDVCTPLHVRLRRNLDAVGKSSPFLNDICRSYGNGSVNQPRTTPPLPLLDDASSSDAADNVLNAARVEADSPSRVCSVAADNESPVTPITDLSVNIDVDVGRRPLSGAAGRSLGTTSGMQTLDAIESDLSHILSQVDGRREEGDVIPDSQDSATATVRCNRVIRSGIPDSCQMTRNAAIAHIRAVLPEPGPSADMPVPVDPPTPRLASNVSAACAGTCDVESNGGRRMSQALLPLAWNKDPLEEKTSLERYKGRARQRTKDSLDELAAKHRDKPVPKIAKSIGLTKSIGLSRRQLSSDSFGSQSQSVLEDWLCSQAQRKRRLQKPSSSGILGSLEDEHNFRQTDDDRPIGLSRLMSTRLVISGSSTTRNKGQERADRLETPDNSEAESNDDGTSVASGVSDESGRSMEPTALGASELDTSPGAPSIVRTPVSAESETSQDRFADAARGSTADGLSPAYMSTLCVSRSNPYDILPRAQREQPAAARRPIMVSSRGRLPSSRARTPSRRSKKRNEYAQFLGEPTAVRRQLPDENKQRRKRGGPSGNSTRSQSGVPKKGSRPKRSSVTTEGGESSFDYSAPFEQTPMDEPITVLESSSADENTTVDGMDVSDATTPVSRKRKTRKRVLADSNKIVEDEDSTLTAIMKPSKRRKCGLALTGLHTAERNEVNRIFHDLGKFNRLQVVVGSETTHLVCGPKPRRTANALKAVVRGCTVVGLDWVLASMEAGMWLDEEEFAVNPLTAHKPPYPVVARVDEKTHLRSLLAEEPKIYVSLEATQPPPDVIANLVNLCGGHMVKSRRRAGLIVGPETNPAYISKAVSEKWLLDSITQGHRLRKDMYRVESDTPPG